MARKSHQASNVVPIRSNQHLTPPRTLPAAQKVLWRAVVDCKPADWFGPDTAPLRLEYVRAAAACDVLEQRVASALDSGNVDAVAKLTRIRNTESQRVAAFATKMRISQQSKYDARKAARRNRGPSLLGRPWDS